MDEPFMDRATVDYFLANYMSDFHSMDPGVLTAPATAPYPGMIAIVQQAFASKGHPLN